MESRFVPVREISPRAFIDTAGVELHRAERYRVFVSLSVIDLDFVRSLAGDKFDEAKQRMVKAVRESIRACDSVALVGEHCLSVLFPETSRQGAEIAIRRLSDLVRSELSSLVGREVKDVVPVEMASYPDTAGAKALSVFLTELADKNRN
ncbi:MAG: GGDEF domain-containing protein [candidate division Zixibacteria bacterium]|nr:GGDEF domain-containing protein [candidate division Zixibacteria bacterium]